MTKYIPRSILLDTLLYHVYEQVLLPYTDYLIINSLTYDIMIQIIKSILYKMK
jgi:hypothetical protein